MNLIRRVKKLEERGSARRRIGRWLNEGEDPKEVRAEMLESGEITEGDFVQFVRWRTREEESALRGTPQALSSPVELP